ncbi:MAG: EAL domain-containing protein [bacterium]|nr:EAL domain-containing protein [bacterium]
MKAIRILLLEDSPEDAELIQAELIRGGLDIEIHNVASEEQFITSLVSFKPDIILADYTLPGLDGMTALTIRNERACDTPFIFVTGSLGEERAINTLKAGATDYILKDNMSRLATSVARARQETEYKKEKSRIATDLERERKLIRSIQDTVKALIIVLDSNGRILHVNPEAERVLGSLSPVLIGSVFCSTFISADDVKITNHHMRMALKNNRQSANVWRTRTRNGHSIMWSTSGITTEEWQSSRILLCGVNISAQESAEEKAHILDNFDRATGLPNRKLFLQQLGQYCSDFQSDTNKKIVVMMIGLPRLQEIQNSCGEAVTNHLLNALVQRLRTWQSDHGLLARVSDNAFAIAFKINKDELTVVVPQILESLRQPVYFEDKHFVLPAYGGTAVYLRDADEPTLLLQAAETARQSAESAKEQGYVFYTSVISTEAQERLQLETDLRLALNTPNELLMHYQPQIDINTGKIIGLEALVRWQHPRRGLLAPDTFIPAAESCGLMRDLGWRVLRETCWQIRAWQQAGLNPPLVAINLSASQFAEPLLPENIATILQEFGLDASQIELELTESTSMSNPEATILIMTQLRNRGIRLSIDDFGTGYSNLSYLKRFPIDCLKLDQAFVRDIATDANDLAIAEAIIAMAHKLGLEVIAEGVETEEQLLLLGKAGCHTIQGYYFSRPRPGQECAGMLSQHFSMPDTVKNLRGAAGS